PTPTERPALVGDASQPRQGDNQRGQRGCHATLPVVPIGPGHHHLWSVPDRHLQQLQRPLDPRRPPAAGHQPDPGALTHGPRTLAHGPGTAARQQPNQHAHARSPRIAASCVTEDPAMVIHYQPERLRSNSDQPTAITNVLVATSGSSNRTGDIPLGTPTCSARSRRGRWALYPNGDQVVVLWPGGAVVGPPVEVAGELDRLGGGGHDALDDGAVRAIRQLL